MELSHILIEVNASQNATTEEKEKAENEAKEKAQEVINRLNNGEKFEDLSKELNDDASVKENGGYLGKDILVHQLKLNLVIILFTKLVKVKSLV